MKPIQVEEVAEGGYGRDDCMDNWAVMVPLARLKLPSRVSELPIIRSSSAGAGGGRGDAEAAAAAAEEEGEISSISSESYHSEDTVVGDPEESHHACRGVFMGAEGAAQVIAGDCGSPFSVAGECTSCLSDGAASSCETPKGHAFAIPEPVSPPSPPRKKRALANRNPPRGAVGFFPLPDNFEVFLSALASPF